MAHGSKTVAILLLFGSVRNIVAERSFVIDFQACSYEYNPVFVKNMSAKFINYNDHNAVNMSFVLAQNVDQFQITVWAIEKRSNGRNWIPFNVTREGCQLLNSEGILSNPLVKSFLKEVTKQLQGIPKKCPIAKNKVFWASHLYLNEDMFPPYLPEVNLKTTMLLNRQNINVLKFFSTTVVQAKSGKRLRQQLSGTNCDWIY